MSTAVFAPPNAAEGGTFDSRSHFGWSGANSTCSLCAEVVCKGPCFGDPDTEPPRCRS